MKNNKLMPLFLRGLLSLCFSGTTVFFTTEAFANPGKKAVAIADTGALSDTKMNVANQKTAYTKTPALAPDANKDQQLRADQTQSSNAKAQTGNFSAYSFRPLLIQGKKRLIQKTKDMKVEGGNIVESQLFFIDVDFKERIFENEAVQ